MDIAVLSNNNIKQQEIENKAKKYGFNIALKNQEPDIVFCIGGDGTILYAEEKFPSVPKITIKNEHHIGKRCIYTIEQIDDILSKLSQNKFKTKKNIKIKCLYKNQKITALNEIQIRNILPSYAIRFSIFAKQDNKIIFRKKNIIGDGCIFSTPFGSSAYFKSIGGKKFKNGFGIGLNNVFNKKKKIYYFDDDCIFECILDRGPCFLLHDNSKNIITLKTNEKIILEKEKNYFEEVHL
ncbi:MAG: hypothetical protein B6U87_00070 [Candidatus Aenigmarchaeota archaeon ex4484_52]|nr:MAG: hypothetical protein B6U87_00070 [Candidatus Aenigmarchaeota archaeon ex4484_52]